MRMTIELSNDEALVLFELLSDYGTTDEGRRLEVRNAAERNALWSLEAALEKVMVTPLQADYAEKLAAAQDRLEQKGGSW